MMHLLSRTFKKHQLGPTRWPIGPVVKELFYEAYMVGRTRSKQLSKNMQFCGVEQGHPTFA